MVAHKANKPAGKLYVVSAPSGAGKDTLVTRMLDIIPTLRETVSHTTRSPRPGEINGTDYHFVSEAEFEAEIARGAFVEYANVFGNYYGTSENEIAQILTEGLDAILILDVLGAESIRKVFPDAITVFVAPPSIEELARRLRTRGTETEEVIQKRLSRADEELSQQNRFDHVIINDDLGKAVEQFKAIFS